MTNDPPRSVTPTARVCPPTGQEAPLPGPRQPARSAGLARFARWVPTGPTPPARRPPYSARRPPRAMPLLGGPLPALVTDGCCVRGGARQDDANRSGVPRPQLQGRLHTKCRPGPQAPDVSLPWCALPRALPGCYRIATTQNAGPDARPTRMRQEPGRSPPAAYPQLGYVDPVGMRNDRNIGGWGQVSHMRSWHSSTYGDPSPPALGAAGLITSERGVQLPAVSVRVKAAAWRVLLQVEPLPGAPDTYTVPFAGAGFLVYVVDQQHRIATPHRRAGRHDLAGLVIGSSRDRVL
jgi:hypothetical protein